MDAQALTTLAPVLQWGFAGFCLLLLGVIVWLIRQLLQILRANNRVIERNTAAIIAVTKDTEETRDEVRALREELMRRTCMMRVTGKEYLLPDPDAPLAHGLR